MESGEVNAIHIITSDTSKFQEWAKHGLNWDQYMFPRQGWTIGRVGSIEIKLNISLAFIALLVAYVLAVGYLPSRVPHTSSALYWITGLLVSVVFIGSILWHELAHSLVGLR